jgi:predicted nucleic acid-binding protein
VTPAYLDSSAFVKMVVAEPESDALRGFLGEQGGRSISSALLRAEALRAVRRYGLEGLARVRGALRRMDFVAVDDAVLDAAGVLDPAVLRTLDAIHLATALMLGEDLSVLLTYDDRMKRAAEELGVPTAQPR